MLQINLLREPKGARTNGPRVSSVARYLARLRDEKSAQAESDVARESVMARVVLSAADNSRGQCYQCGASIASDGTCECAEVLPEIR